jgi:Reverse transcriptase (RNA-dependent DNA polymerase)
LKIPEGLEVAKEDENKVCSLKRALYGLKQSPKAWNNRFNDFMSNQNFKRSKSDYCLYSFNDQINNVRCYLLLYVDDILVACNDEFFLNNLKTHLFETFKIRKLELDYLGIRICKNVNKVISIDQTLSIQCLVKKFNVENSKITKTPIEKNLNLKRNSDINLKTKLPFKELLGSLMYIMMGTRPDICFSVSYFGKFQDCATDEQFKHLLRVLKYLKCTINYKLYFFNNENNLSVYSDADFANDSEDRKSISGYCVKLHGNLISWSSKKQSLVTLSSTESEFIAICVASCELMYFKNLLMDLNVEISLPVALYEDNQSTIKLIQNFENNRRCKHIDVKWHFIVDLIKQGIIALTYVCTNNQLADIFTKALGPEKFYNFLKMMSVKE